MNLSVCIITKNEALKLKKCLASLKRYDVEIVVVDTGSTDETLQIIEEYADIKGNYKWNDEPALNKCTFFAAIDKLQRAKAVDPSVAEEANKLISSYSAYTPEAKDLFMLGYKAGDRITIGGWIGETTTIR